MDAETCGLSRQTGWSSDSSPEIRCPEFLPFRFCAIAARPIFVALLTATASIADDPAKPKDIETDRPDVTPYTVPKGSIQLESGVVWTDDELSRALDFTESLLRISVSDGAEARVGVPTYFRNMGHHTPGSGFNDLLIGAKQRIASVAGFDLAIAPALSLPTGSKTRTSHGFDPQFEIPWQRDITEGWSLSGTAGVFYLTEDGRRRTQGENQIELEKDVNRRTDLFLEYQSFFGDGPVSNSLQMGGGYKIRPNHRLDFFVVVALSRAAPNLAVGIGYSFRLDRLLAKK
jgi:hypothetical protein